MRPIEERKEVLRLYLEEHKGQTEISKQTGINFNTVKTWIGRYRRAQGLAIGNHAGHPTKVTAEEKRDKDYEKRIRQLEMEVELLRDFLAETERRSISK